MRRASQDSGVPVASDRDAYRKDPGDRRRPRLRGGGRRLHRQAVQPARGHTSDRSAPLSYPFIKHRGVHRPYARVTGMMISPRLVYELMFVVASALAAL